MSKCERQPATAARIAAFLLAVLLAGILLLLCTTVTVSRLTSSDTLYMETAMNPEILDTETEQIRAGIDTLAEKYGFDAEKMAELFNREAVAEFGKRAVTWWTGIITRGSVTEIPAFDLTGAEALLDGDASFSEGLQGWQIREKKEQVTEAIGKVVSDAVIPVRTLVVNGVFRKVLDKVPLKKLLEISRSLMLPLLAAAFCLSGLLALTVSRRLHCSLLYFGGSFGAAGLIVILVTGLFLLMNIRGMIGEISANLTRQFILVERKILLQAGATALLLLAAGAAGLVFGNRRSTAEETA